ncbi:MAG: adenosylcobinamide-GDP ribazoletransferase [Nitrospirae bacterium]|nr:adenosylcobinamide-GDP ribazoletransferase [Nitrospirota bacterium]
MKHLILAFQFLTIIPIRVNTGISDADIAKSSSAFVIVGLIQGILLIATDYISGMVFHPDLVIGIILLVLVLSNGGFHLDGLADTFDAIAARGDKEKKLSIMKDSTIGPIGVIAIVLALLLKFLALNGLSHFPLFTFYFSLFLMPILPKWTMVISMFYGKPAREDGLGRIFINRISFKEIAISTLILFLLLILLQVFFSRYMSNTQYAFYAVLLVTMYFFCRVWVNFFDKKFGGLNGDTLGAISEITEIIFLLMVIVWSRLFI